MELGGDEKRIQALFSELALEDQSYAPRFERLWMRAAAAEAMPARSYATASAVIVTVVVIAVAYALASRPWNRSSQPEQANIAALSTLPAPSALPMTKPLKLMAAESKSLRIRRYRKPSRQRQSERVAASMVAMLSNWQSPTDVFLESPTASVLSSLPQLNQSARDLKEFLLKNNQATKESKQ
jgi:hypothetical protein